MPPSKAQRKQQAGALLAGGTEAFDRLTTRGEGATERRKRAEVKLVSAHMTEEQACCIFHAARAHGADGGAALALLDTNAGSSDRAAARIRTIKNRKKGKPSQTAYWLGQGALAAASRATQHLQGAQSKRLIEAIEALREENARLRKELKAEKEKRQPGQLAKLQAAVMRDTRQRERANDRERRARDQRRGAESMKEETRARKLLKDARANKEDEVEQLEALLRNVKAQLRQAVKDKKGAIADNELLGLEMQEKDEVINQITVMLQEAREGPQKLIKGKLGASYLQHVYFLSLLPSTSAGTVIGTLEALGHETCSRSTIGYVRDSGDIFWSVVGTVWLKINGPNQPHGLTLVLDDMTGLHRNNFGGAVIPCEGKDVVCELHEKVHCTAEEAAETVFVALCAEEERFQEFRSQPGVDDALCWTLIESALPETVKAAGMPSPDELNKLLDAHILTHVRVVVTDNNRGALKEAALVIEKINEEMNDDVLRISLGCQLHALCFCTDKATAVFNKYLADVGVRSWQKGAVTVTGLVWDINKAMGSTKDGVYAKGLADVFAATLGQDRVVDGVKLPRVVGNRFLLYYDWSLKTLVVWDMIDDVLWEIVRSTDDNKEPNNLVCSAVRITASKAIEDVLVAMALLYVWWLRPMRFAVAKDNEKPDKERDRGLKGTEYCTCTTEFRQGLDSLQRDGTLVTKQQPVLFSKSPKMQADFKAWRKKNTKQLAAVRQKLTEDKERKQRVEGLVKKWAAAMQPHVDKLMGAFIAGNSDELKGEEKKLAEQHPRTSVG
jgi:hypothetical protein